MAGKVPQSPAAIAILTLAEIKAATRSFDRGRVNVFDTLDAIAAALEAYRSAAESRRDAA